MGFQSMVSEKHLIYQNPWDFGASNTMTTRTGLTGGCGFRGKLLDTQRAADSTVKRRRPGPAGQSWPGAHSWGLSIGIMI